MYSYEFKITGKVQGSVATEMKRRANVLKAEMKQSGNVCYSVIDIQDFS